MWFGMRRKARLELSESKKRAFKSLAGCVVIIAIVFGTLNIMSNYIGTVCEQTGASVVQVSLLFSIASAVSAVAGLAAAALIERVPMRRIMLGGAISFVLFFACLYFAQDITLVYVGAVFFGLSQVFAGFTVSQPLITWWHAKGVGKKISSLYVAMSVGAVILSPTIAYLLGAFGYQTTVLFNGGVLGIVLIVCVVALVSNRPSSYGLEAYGSEEAKPASAESEESAARSGKPEGLSAMQALRTYPFWAILLGASLLMIPANGFVTNASVIFQSCGFDAVTAGAMISVYSACAVVWVFLYGALSDKFGARKVSILYTCAAVVILATFFLVGGKAGAIILTVTFGIVTAYGGMIGAVTYGPLYGPRAVGTLVSLCLVGTGVGAMLAAPIATAMYEATGGYEAFMGMSAVLCVVILFLFATATSRRMVEKVASIKPE